MRSIGADVNPFNRALAGAGGMLNPAHAHGAAMLDRLVNQQAQIIAYVDDYKLLILTTLPAMLLLLVMRRPRYVTGVAPVQRGGHGVGPQKTSPAGAGEVDGAKHRG